MLRDTERQREMETERENMNETEPEGLPLKSSNQTKLPNLPETAQPAQA